MNRSPFLYVKIVNEYLEGNYSYKDLASMNGLNHSIIVRWVQRAKINGMSALASKKAKRSFSGQDKVNILDYMLTNGLSFNETGAHFDVEPSLIYQWKRKFDEHGIDALQAKRGRPSKQMIKKKAIPKNKLDALKQENLELKQQLQTAKMELAVSKKLEALAIKKRRRKNNLPK